MRNPTAAGGELDVAALHDVEIVFADFAEGFGVFLAAAEHRVPVGELAGQDVGEDLGVAVRVGGEAGLGSNAVFVQDAQGAEGGELRGEIGGEGEGVVGVEPAVVSVAAGGGGAGGYFGGGEEGHCFRCFAGYGHGIVIAIEYDHRSESFGVF